MEREWSRVLLSRLYVEECRYHEHALHYPYICHQRHVFLCLLCRFRLPPRHLWPSTSDAVIHGSHVASLHPDHHHHWGYAPYQVTPQALLALGATGKSANSPQFLLKHDQHQHLMLRWHSSTSTAVYITLAGLVPLWSMLLKSYPTHYVQRA